MEKDYKDTLILPKTDFPMKANLPQKEPIRYKKWQSFAYAYMSGADLTHGISDNVANQDSMESKDSSLSLDSSHSFRMTVDSIVMGDSKINEDSRINGSINENSGIIENSRMTGDNRHSEALAEESKDISAIPQCNRDSSLPLRMTDNLESNSEKRVDSKNHKNFVLHDGPPYANGHLHVGHALNKILKDFVTKYHFFSGSNAFYTPGWDCHGLPIEQQVSSNFEKSGTMPSKIEIRKACREHARKFVDIQKEEFLAMGIVGDFENPYLTMKYDFESRIYQALVKIANNSLLARRSKPIFWSWAARSALAEAEVEYKDKKSDSIFVKFALNEESLKKLKIENLQTDETPYAIIWTTTPWTLPSNVAIAFKPESIYVLLSCGAIVASELMESLLLKGLVSGKVLKSFDSKELENLGAINPLNDRKSHFILADFVSMEDGSGMVHCAPGHGEDDYFACLKYNLEVIMPVDDGGLYDESIVSKGLFREEDSKEFVGMHIFKAQKRIIEMLGESGALLKCEEITHSYPHCWRTNKPVIFRATKQWFILMDKPYYEGKTLREVVLEEIDKVKFYPQSGQNRLRTMVENRPDWCISRQREWGVPIAFFIHKESNEIVLDKEITDHIAMLFAKEGCDVWWDREIEDLLPPSYKQYADRYEKNMHILDVWFDSGSTWSAVLQSGQYNAGHYPSDIYLEGSDQHRGWFQSSLLVSCAINARAPYRGIITHGFITDDKGEKMSKSKGNVLAPENIIAQYGSEILRLWVALSDYQSDVRISPSILKQVSDNYLKIRNTIRFLLANTQGLEKLDFSGTSPIDRWILREAEEIFGNILDLFSRYDFSKGFQILNGFMTATLSGIYLDVCKDSLYCDSISSKRRIAIQSVFALLANRFLHTIAPFLTYTVDEALEYAGDVIKGGAEHVFALKPMDFISFSDESYEDFDFLLQLRKLFNEKVDFLKKEKSIKSSLELELVIGSDVNLSNLHKLAGMSALICDFLMISKCSISEIPSDSLFTIEINSCRLYAVKSNLHKCPRCWQYRASKESGLCDRCSEVFKQF